MRRAKRKQGSKEIHLIFVLWSGRGCQAVCGRHAASWQQGLCARPRGYCDHRWAYDGKEDARESQAVQAISGALHESLFFHSVPVTT